MKAANFLALGSVLFQSVVSLALPVQDTSAGLDTRDASIQATANSPDLDLDLYIRTTVGENLSKRLPAARKHCQKAKVRRAGSTSSEEECPALPTKDQIKTNWRSNPAFNAGKLFFYSSPPGADVAEAYAKANFPGYSTLIPSFHPAGWEDTWTFYEEIADDFWKLASEAFAEIATGTVYVLLPDGDANAVT